jgi:predicted GH43/DUF377 family glycosyl hydrolase
MYKWIGLTGIIYGFLLSGGCHWADGSKDKLRGKVADKPLFRDPVYDGATDPVVCWNNQEKKWFMFYTSRRANVPGLKGVSWVHGSPIGIAESADGGATWTYRGTAKIDYGQGEFSYWAPEILYHNGIYHMYLSFVPGMHTDWSGTRDILHLTSNDMLEWKYQSTLKLSSNRVIDACVFQMSDGTWRMWYNNETDHKSIYYADSADLYTWKDGGKVIGDQPGEGPNVFEWKNKYWMIVDVWDGQGVYWSDDAVNWTRQKENLLQKGGTGSDDTTRGHHADVVVSGDRAYLFYFTHPGTAGQGAKKDGTEQRRSSVQVVQLEYKDGLLSCDRNKPVYMYLCGSSVSQKDMQGVYEQVKTPYKYGVVIEPPAGKMVDGPTVFRWNDQWYMVYFQLEENPKGYTTQLAVSKDLLNWRPLGNILPRGPTGQWNSAQAAGGIALYDTTWGGTCQLESFDGKYWLSYLGGEKPGYETPPLSIGMAWTDKPSVLKLWSRLPEPVLRPTDSDIRDFEGHTLFKSTIIHDREKILGSPFVMFYNAAATKGGERIGIAVSEDMVKWKRFGLNCVVANRSSSGKPGISGDPQIAKIGDLWVMFYFGAFWRPGAFDTFACSYDLVNWTKWEGPDLISSSESWDRQFAHKPWVIHYNGVVYHFYCAVGDKGRVIALATSKDLRKQ